MTPSGNNPTLTSAWNPLQIPMINPSLSRSFSIASLILGLRNTVAMNLPDPSGSSEAENPPGIIII